MHPPRGTVSTQARSHDVVPAGVPSATPPPIGERYLAECRSLVIDEIRAIVQRGVATEPRAHELLLDYPLRRAKALRPALCIAVGRALGAPLDEILPSAAILEIYHNAFLIHDDIEDGSLERRGGPALHQTHGIATAINCGDGLLALTLRPLLDNTDRLGLGRALRILELFAAMVTETFEGQAVELRWIDEQAWQLSDADYEQMVAKKTCAYSFVAPALVGAAVARADAETEAALTPLLRSLGLAFQIQDDLLNLERGSDAYGKELAGDLWEGKRTLLLLHALRSASEDERTRALAILARPRPARDSARVATLLDRLRDEGSVGLDAHAAIMAELAGGDVRCKTAADVEFLWALIERSGAVAHARQVAQRHADDAEAAWVRVAPALGDSVHARFLGWLKDYVVRREW